jgi:hypothetical protein
MCKKAFFYNQRWQRINHSLEDLDPNVTENQRILEDIAKVSRVPGQLVCKEGKVCLPASYVLHYAGMRQCTREEDRAYSLMGILNIKIPILYGEGQQSAIGRLIDEILRSKSDVSVFHWVGMNYGCRLPGKSMYPVSLDAYRLKGSEKRRKHIEPVTISNAGVESLFEILQFRPIFPPVDYPGGLLGLLDKIGGKHPNIDCTIRFRIEYLRSIDDDKAETDTTGLDRFVVCCPLPVLRRQVRYAQNRKEWKAEHPESLTGSWVLVRLASTASPRWFLCMLGFAQGKQTGYVGLRLPAIVPSIKPPTIHPDHIINIRIS